MSVISLYRTLSCTRGYNSPPEVDSGLLSPIPAEGSSQIWQKQLNNTIQNDQWKKNHVINNQTMVAELSKKSEYRSKWVRILPSMWMKIGFSVWRQSTVHFWKLWAINYTKQKRFLFIWNSLCSKSSLYFLVRYFACMEHSLANQDTQTSHLLKKTGYLALLP